MRIRTANDHPYPRGAKHRAQEGNLIPLAAYSLSIRPAATSDERAVLLSTIAAEKVYYT